MDEGVGAAERIMFLVGSTMHGCNKSYSSVKMTAIQGIEYTEYLIIFGFAEKRN